MTREQIEKAAMLFAGAGERGECPYNPDAKNGFIAGAEWRINAVWHDVSEKPKENRLILTEDDYCGEPDYCICQVTYPKFEDDIILFCTKRWAYIDDLLPERKEEAECGHVSYV